MNAVDTNIDADPKARNNPRDDRLRRLDRPDHYEWRWNPFGQTWDFSNPGAFGDSFGPLSALMASIAAISAFAAYRIQIEETGRLRDRQFAEDTQSKADRDRLLQREEHADDRALRLRVENTFFQLLSTFRGIVSDIDVRVSSGNLKQAHDAFKSILSRLRQERHVNNEDVALAWGKTVDAYRNDLNHYFRFMYHVVKFIDESPIDNKYFYVRLLRALLSESELVLLAVNCAHGDGREKFKRLLEKYAFLHNVSPGAKREWGLDAEYEDGAFLTGQ